MTQILPPDDDFAAGSPTMGSFACLYLGCAVTSSSISFWNPTGSGFIAPRPIHGAYQSTDSNGIHDYNAAFHSSGTTTRTASGVMFRRAFGADCTTSATFEMRSLAGGAPGAGDLAPRGVLARVQGGTLVGDGTADVRYRDVDCYMAALYQKASDSTLRLGLYRWNAGVSTLLTESVSLTSGLVVWTALATVTLIVSGSGATVSLTGRVTGLGTTAVITINASDTSGSRITTAGRSGFFMGSDRIVSGKTTVDLCHLFAVDESGLRTLQDEFRRLQLGAAKQTSADAAGTAGSGYLSSAYYWDGGTYDGSDGTFQGSKRLGHSSGTVVFDNQITDDNGPTSRVAAGRMILAQRPADNLFSQHRTVSITMPNSGHPTASTGEVWAGIALRGTQAKPTDQIAGTPGQGINSNPNVPSGTAYVLALRAKTSTQVIWQLHRIKNNTHTAIARKTENSPFVGAFPGYGTPFALELEVFPRDEADLFGVVQIVCKVNGSLLAFDTFLAPAGVTNPSTGVFQDSTNRIQSGDGEGLFICNGLTSSGTDVNNYDPVFDAWTQGSLTNAALLDRDQATITLAAEPSATGTALDAVLTPDWPFEVDYVTHHVSTPFESGHRQTMPRYLDQGTDAVFIRKRYRFRRRGVNATDTAALEMHWNAHKSEAAFAWTPPGDTAIVARYASNLRRSLIGPGMYEVEFEVEECA